MEFFYNTSADRRAYGKTLLLAVRLTALIIVTACLQVSAKTTTAQRVSISLHNGSLERLFTEIEKKTNYVFFYDVTILRNTKAVTVEVKDASVEDILQTSLKGQALDYSIHDRTIFVKKKDDKTGEKITSVINPKLPGEISGTVLAEDGTPLSGATIKLKDGRAIAMTDERGAFKVKNIGGNTVIVISFTGYAPQEVQLANKSSFTVSLVRATNKLDEVQVIAYGTTTERLNTGNVTTVKSKEIERQPVSNVLAAIEGLVPGLFITQSTGSPGGSFSVQIRGQSSLANGSNPFYVIDGVPYDAQLPGSPLNSALHGGSPLNFINPYDIESVEVLKDADATSIYGSRAANGAILITTKKGKAGVMKVDLNVYSGISRPARAMQELNTQQYLEVRHEAFTNDGATPGSGDYDINGVWDTTRYTDWRRVLVHNPGSFTNAQATVSGGNTNTQFLVGAGYFRQATPFPTLITGDGADQKASVHFNINSVSPNKKFRMAITGSYISDKNTVQSIDFNYNAATLPPDAPALHNPDGSLNWQPTAPGLSGTWANPLSGLYVKYRGLTSNLVGNAIIGYTILPGLEIKSSFGYTNTQTDEINTFPTTIYDPGYHVTSGSSNFNTMKSNSWIIEPQVSYKLNIGMGIFNALFGESFHENNNSVQGLSANGFPSDALLENIQAAGGSISASSNSAQYKYNAFFGRLNYNWQDKYLLNLTARRDGSSRFGPGKQFGDFGAVGAAWIFTKENFMQRSIPWLSFGKIRGSYGITGNDQIGDYQFLDLYSTTPYPYQGTQGLRATNLFNPNLAWEVDKKLEGGIELGFLKDRISIQASYYRNRSGNQLISTPVSLVTGYSSIQSNLPAQVQNMGQEFVVNTINIKTKNFLWSSAFNLSISRNKLLSYPNLATSGYASVFVVGQPLTIQRVYHMIGVNDTTGLYQFADSKGAPTYTPSYQDDRTVIINTAPAFYGGFQNSFQYKGLSLDIFFQFVKQKGKNIFGSFPGMSGLMTNIPVSFLNRWQKPGDIKPYQRVSQTGGDAYRAFGNAKQSDFAYSDASFIRLKNLAISYQLPTRWKQKMHVENCRIYLQGQNLLTITKYNGVDPESKDYGLPPMRIFTAGFQVTL